MAPPPAEEDVRAELDRVLASALFVNAGRLSRLLRFTVERTLAGEADRLKEYRLGVEVFDRDEQYDPRLDSIVRVEARRLRSRLVEYYEGEGRHNPIRITFAKGTYAPRFEPRVDAEPGLPSLLLPDGEDRPAKRWSWAAAAVVCAIAAAGWILVKNRGVESAPSAAPEAIATVAVLPLAHFGPDAVDDGLADRLTDGIINELARRPSLAVISRTTMMQYKGVRRPLPAVAADVHATVVLEGSVIREHGRVGVKARLVDTRTDTKFWADFFDGDPGEILDLQRRVAAAAFRALEQRAAAGAAAR